MENASFNVRAGSSFEYAAYFNTRQRSSNRFLYDFSNPEGQIQPALDAFLFNTSRYSAAKTEFLKHAQTLQSDCRHCFLRSCSCQTPGNDFQFFDSLSSYLYGPNERTLELVQTYLSNKGSKVPDCFIKVHAIDDLVEVSSPLCSSNSDVSSLNIKVSSMTLPASISTHPPLLFDHSILNFKMRKTDAQTKMVYNLDSRLRPSQRPNLHKKDLKSFIKVDRLTSPRRAPKAARESFLLSKQASFKRPQQEWSSRREGFTNTFGSSNGRNIRASTQDLVFQDQNVRQTISFRSATPLMVQPHYGNSNAGGFSRSRTQGVIWPTFPMVTGVPTVETRVYPSHRQLQARTHVSRFLRGSTVGQDVETHETRLAVALDVDRFKNVLAGPTSGAMQQIRSVPITPLLIHNTRLSTALSYNATDKPAWRDNEWMCEDGITLLEAPYLRDDFYCSVLAYSHRLQLLAVALGLKMYLWSEAKGVVNTPDALGVQPSRTAYITSITFSSETGARAILVIGRADGRLLLWSPLDAEPRYLKMRISKAVSHVSFRPASVRRPSQRHSSLIADNEVLLVGDEQGLVSVYFVEWPEAEKRFLFGWHGSISLHARISVHTQQICGISWSMNGDYFATGGNDNLCCLFQTNKILADDHRSLAPAIELHRDTHGSTHLTRAPGESLEILIGREKVRHEWKLNAAIKAIAFCPWQTGLLAIGGGSNDRCIHFFHTISGSSLATIDCAAQVTALVWSANRREIAATFGFAQPEHPYRIAVYSWPSCEQLVAIPWASEMRALHAISYPGRPNAAGKQREGSVWGSGAIDEGCLVVAGSDGSIKFHEIWSETRRATAPRGGLLGGSDILESLHGIEKEGGEIIR